MKPIDSDPKARSKRGDDQGNRPADRNEPTTSSKPDHVRSDRTLGLIVMLTIIFVVIVAIVVGTPASDLFKAYADRLWNLME